jgi:hypothetical protein
MAETIGWLADKLSIAELKIFHLRERSSQPDTDPHLIAECAKRLAVLERQRDDLAEELTSLLGDLLSGRTVPKVYRQFKLYNDPRFQRRHGNSPPGSG